MRISRKLKKAAKFIKRESNIGFETSEPLEHYVYGRFTKWKQKYLNYVNGGEEFGLNHANESLSLNIVEKALCMSEYKMIAKELEEGL